MHSLETLVFRWAVMSIAAVAAGRLSFCAPAAGQEDAAPAEGDIRVVEVRDVQIDAASPALRKRVPEVFFEDLPLEQAVEFISEFGELNLIVRWQVLQDAGVARDVPVTVKCRNLRLSQILWLVLSEAAQNKTELGYDLHGDRMVVASTVADLEAYKVVKIYDVRSLLRGAEDWDRQWRKRKAPEVLRIRQAFQAAEAPGAPATLPAAASPGISTEPLVMFHELAPEHPTHAYVAGPADQLVELVEQAIRPETWLVHGGKGTAHCFGGVLVIRASRSVHRQLEALLSALLASVAQAPEQG